MTVKDAIHKLQGSDEHNWIRPISWRGSGNGISIKDGSLYVVPSSRGGWPWIPSIGDLVEDWEIVDPDEVLKERESGG